MKIPWKWAIVISIALLAGIIIGNLTPLKWLSDTITFIGILASIFGLLLTLKQLQSISDITEQTRKAVEENKKIVSKIWSVEDLSAVIKEIALVQHHLLDNEYHFSMIRIMDIRMKVTDMVNNERLKEYYDMQEVERFLPILQNDYLNIQKKLMAANP